MQTSFERFVKCEGQLGHPPPPCKGGGLSLEFRVESRGFISRLGGFEGVGIPEDEIINPRSARRQGAFAQVVQLHFSFPYQTNEKTALGSTQAGQSFCLNTHFSYTHIVSCHSMFVKCTASLVDICNSRCHGRLTVSPPPLAPQGFCREQLRL